MKKRFLFVFVAFAFLIVFYGCTGEESSVDEIPHYTGLIENWQAREASCETIETECYTTGYFYNDIRHTILEQIDIDYASEGGNNYWQTSCESLAAGSGDCEDMAILAYRALMDSCLIDYYDLDVRIRVIDEDDSSSNHVVTIIYYQENVYQIDNLSINNETINDRIVIEFDAETIF